jgi:hypothetical protein
VNVLKGNSRAMSCGYRSSHAVVSLDMASLVARCGGKLAQQLRTLLKGAAAYEEAQQLRTLLKGAGEQAASYAEELAELEAELVTLEFNKSVLEAFVESAGVAEVALEKFLQVIKVCRQAYYSGAFVGNHVAKLLDNLNGLWAAMRASVANDSRALASTNAIIERVEPLWTALARLHGPTRAARLLSDEEVESLCQAASDVTRAARAAYPTKHLQLKLHVIEDHLGNFARKWRSTGLFVEDACESIHALVNKLNRRFSCLHCVLKSKSKDIALKIFQKPDFISRSAALKTKRARGQYKAR